MHPSVSESNEKDNKNKYIHYFHNGFTSLKTAESLRGDSSLLTTKSPKVPGTYLIELREMKSWSWSHPVFELGTTGLGIRCFTHKIISPWGTNSKKRHLNLNFKRESLMNLNANVPSSHDTFLLHHGGNV